MPISLNQILFGPPGTGKTFATIDAALAIIDPGLMAGNPEVQITDWQGSRARRGILKKRFDELLAEGRIRFVTFHQSFSYEDFVEGLRAQSNENNQIEYKVEDGVFKRLCDDARTEATRKAIPEIAIRPRIWKISIDGTGPSPTRQYCLNHGEARIGWGQTGNLTLLDQPNEYFDSLGSNSKNTLQAFGTEIAQGDILVCIRSETEAAAIGVVNGRYRFEAEPPPGIKPDYQHVLGVNWLHRNLSLPMLELNDNVKFTLKTVYPLYRFSWGDLLAHLEEAGVAAPEAAATNMGSSQPYVLIIDEINRGNVSRILGELITLIEPSKRYGSPEVLSTRLPYSKRPFSVPENVYLIGTMNTADRSLAGLDIALRRRFSFRELLPRPELFDGIQISEVPIGALLRVMNQRIELLLDRDHCLGHAFFIPLFESPTIDELGRIFRMEILPLLQEYFFEDWSRIQWILNDHRKPSEHRFLIKPTNDLATLFGEGVEVNDQCQRWVINEAAFGLPAAYSGIISADTNATT